MDRKRQRLLIIVIAALVLLPGLIISAVQFSNRPRPVPPKPVVVQPAANTPQARAPLAKAISNQASTTGFPYFPPSETIIKQVDRVGQGWYIVTLNVAGAETGTTWTLVHQDGNGNYRLVAGPGTYFYADDLSRDGVPNDIAQKLMARNFQG